MGELMGRGMPMPVPPCWARIFFLSLCPDDRQEEGQAQLRRVTIARPMTQSLSFSDRKSSSSVKCVMR